MKLLIFLGNPGEKYEKTRHNLGFMAGDFLQEKLGAPEFKLNKKCKAKVSKADGFIFAKPQTFMNLSGEATANLLSFYKLKPENLIVIHDDIDLEFGAIREGKNRGSAGHNGVQSIIDSLGTKDFTRWRLGIGRPPSSAKATDGRPEKIPADVYVLQDFKKDELKKIEDILEELSKKLALKI